MVATKGKIKHLPHLKTSTVPFELYLVAHQPVLADLSCALWLFFLPRSKFLHLAGFRPSYKMHTVEKSQRPALLFDLASFSKQRTASASSLILPFISLLAKYKRVDFS